MSGLFQPEQRRLTEEQFKGEINGVDLSYAEVQILRRDYGLPCDESALKELMPERIVAAVWQKIRCKHALLLRG